LIKKAALARGGARNGLRPGSRRIFQGGKTPCCGGGIRQRTARAVTKRHDPTEVDGKAESPSESLRHPPAEVLGHLSHVDHLGRINAQTQNMLSRRLGILGPQPMTDSWPFGRRVRTSNSPSRGQSSGGGVL
jgi:hypothetical protein